MTEPLTIHLIDPVPETSRMAEGLHGLARSHDLQPWLFTRELQIIADGIPHSHPVLTLCPRSVIGPDGLLASLLHEQLHWFEESMPDARDRMIEASRGPYPQVPIDPPEGARTDESTRLHLLVCWLELRALRMLVGDAAAEATIQALAAHHYRWVYRTVIRDEAALGAFFAPFGLVYPHGM